MSSIKVVVPGTLDELVEELKKAGQNSKILAGGTDLIISVNENKIKPDQLIDISGIKEISKIQEEDGMLYIGAMATFSEIAKDKLVNKYFYSLVQAAADVGSKQIRNKGTIGGNLANSSPAGDMLPPLISLNASVLTIDGKNNNRDILVSDLVTGVGRNILTDDEAIIYIKIPLPENEIVTRFVKLGTRSKVSIARLSIAINLVFEKDHISDAIVTLGAVGKTVFRAKIAEEILIGKVINADTKDLFAQALMREIENSILGRYSLPYKKEAIKGIAYDILASL